MEKLSNYIELTVGDYSFDGHEKIVDYTILSNLTRDEIESAYKKGVEILGFDVTQYYQDFETTDTLPEEFVDALIRLEFPEVFSFEKEPPAKYEKISKDSTGNFYVFEPNCCDFGQLYLELWLWIVKLGNSDFEHSFLNAENIAIGGYGFFRF